MAARCGDSLKALLSVLILNALLLLSAPVVSVADASDNGTEVSADFLFSGKKSSGSAFGSGFLCIGQ
ncbi:Uncharacterised protein [Morganella morganii]|nr:Uncharacterised protein [Morganella morganii]